MSNQSQQTFVLKVKDKGKAGFSSFQRGLSGVTKGIKALSVGLGVGVGLLTLMTKRTLEQQDELAKLADRLGTTTGALAGMQHAADQLGSSGDRLAMGLQLLNKNLGDVAALGKGEAKSALDAIGLSAKELIKLPADEKFKLIADKVKGLSTQAEKAAVAQALMGRAGSELLNTLELGSEGIEKMTKEAEELGIALSRTDAARIEAANDAMDRSQKRLQGVANKITVELAPYIEALADSFTGLGKNSINWGEVTATAISWITKGVGVMADGLHGLQIAFHGLKGVGMLAFGGLLHVLDIWMSGVAKAGNAIKDGLIVPMRVLMVTGNALGAVSDETLDKFMMIDIYRFKAPESLKTGMESAFKSADESFAAMKEKLDQPLPSTGINQWAEGVKAKAKELGEQLDQNVNAKLANAGGSGGTGDELTEQEKKENEKIVAAAEGRAMRIAQEAAEMEESRKLRENAHALRIAEIQGNWQEVQAIKLQQYELEKQAEIQRYQNEQSKRAEQLEIDLEKLGNDELRKREIKQLYKQQELDAERNHKELILGINRDKAAEELRIEEQKNAAKKAAMMQGLQASLQALNTYGPQLFGKNKKLAKAQALVSTWSSVQQSWDNAGGYPWGIIPAGLALAAGLKNVANIGKTNISGGGGVGGGVGGGSMGGGGSRTPSSATGVTRPPVLGPASGSQFANRNQEPAQMINITIAGDVNSNGVEGWAEKLKALINEKDFNLIDRNSRNAQDLMAATGGG